MKAKILFILVWMFGVSMLSFSETHEISENDTIIFTNAYVNNLNEIWNVESNVKDKPLKISYLIGTEYGHDYVTIKSVDSLGVDTTILILTGTKSGTVSTLIPNGKAQIIFTSDELVSNYGNPNAFLGLNISFAVDTDDIIQNNLHVSGNTQTEGDLYVKGKIGIGTTVPSKKLEISEGVGGKFTFSAVNCISGYEVAQTIDNTGYKLNVGSSIRDYRIAVDGEEKFKMLANDNYALGKTSLNSITSGSNNTALGNGALESNTTGSYNIGIGQNAGKYITGGSTANTVSTNSIFIGRGTKANANNETNQIVIGFNAVGNGSNTITLGNSDITKTILKGKVGIDKIYPDYKLDVSGSVGLENDLLITSSRLNFGGAVNIINTNKTGTGIASKWAIFNTSGSNGNALQFWSYSNNTGPDFNGGTNRFTITDAGNVGIGTNIPDEKLTVNGIIHAKEIKIDLTGPLADFVFKPSYQLMPLREVEMFVRNNNHLPGIPSASEVQTNGLNVGDMQNKLLQKIEELTLYVIEQGKTIESQHKEIEELKLRMEQ